MKTERKITLFTSLVAGFLAGVTSFSEPLKASAAAQGAYLSDLIIITEEDTEKAKADSYTVISTPIGTQSIRNDKLGSGLTNTYLAYKTTSNANDAIHDMKFMNMTGGFDFAKYDEFLDNVESTTKVITNNLFVAIQGYRDTYNANTPQGKFAYGALNIFRYDEFDGLDSQIVDFTDSNKTGINKRLGDLFLDTSLVANGESKVLVDIFMEGNASILDAIYSILNIANVYNSDHKTVIQALDDIEGTYESFTDRTDLNDTVFTLEADFIRIRDEVNWYRNDSVRKLESFDNSDEALAYTYKLLDDDLKNQTNTANMWTNASKEIPFLEFFKYKGISGKYNNLLELIMDEDAESKEYYPLLACMSPGFRATALLGIVDMFTNAMLDETQYMSRINELKESDPDVKNAIENGELSVFHKVDRALYQKGNVAMTTNAEDGAIKGDESWKNMQDTRSALNKKLDGLPLYLSFGIGGFVFATGIGIIAVRGMISSCIQKLTSTIASFELGKLPVLEGYGAFEAIQQGGKIIYQTAPEATIGEEFVGCEELTVEQAASRCATNAVAANSTKQMTCATTAAKQAMLGTVKLVLTITIIIAVAALIVSIVFAVLHNINKDKPTYNKYTDIPGILCHYEPVYDVSNNGARTKAGNGYVYYYGATNPYKVATSAKYGNTDDGSLKLGENKRNVQDIYNWELGQGKSREWLCLYYTKDRRAGYAITAKSLKIQNTVGTTLAGASSFNKPDIEYNINSVLVSNYYDDPSLKSYNKDIGAVAAKYIRYTNNMRASYGTSTNVGSAVSNGATWIFVFAGLVVGFGGGLLVAKSSFKKKKKALSED